MLCKKGLLSSRYVHPDHILHLRLGKRLSSKSICRSGGRKRNSTASHSYIVRRNSSASALGCEIGNAAKARNHSGYSRVAYANRLFAPCAGTTASSPGTHCKELFSDEICISIPYWQSSEAFRQLFFASQGFQATSSHRSG